MIAHEIDLDMETLTLAHGEQEIVLKREDFAVALSVFRFAYLAGTGRDDLAKCIEAVRQAQEYLRDGPV